MRRWAIDQSRYSLLSSPLFLACARVSVFQSVSECVLLISQLQMTVTDITVTLFPGRQGGNMQTQIPDGNLTICSLRCAHALE